MPSKRCVRRILASMVMMRCVVYRGTEVTNKQQHRRIVRQRALSMRALVSLSTFTCQSSLPCSEIRTYDGR